MRVNTDYILSAESIREKANKILQLTKEGKTNFEFAEEKLPEVAEFVLDVIKENYPDLNIPFHSRWGHFQVGGIDRNATFDNALKEFDPMERARTKLDLVITSVLLDAGAGPNWRYIEDGKKFSRSEGLGVASWHMFKDGAFSEDGTLKAQAAKLKTIKASDIEKHFQVTESNPLIGTEGRANLLKSLGLCIEALPEAFKDGRPGNIIDYMVAKHGKIFKAVDLLKAVLTLFGPIWPSRITIDGVNLGDVWSYPKLGQEQGERLVPFHKLSQWLTYSLIEPIMEAGITVSDVHEMTGLAEYRNGGLFVDLGLFTLRDTGLYKVHHKPDSELIIEWRALTIASLDLLAPLIRDKLGFDQQQFPLAKMLEGGTWHAGRKIAARNRADSSPPIKLDSDGTVF